MLATTSHSIAELYAPKRAPVDQAAFDTALHAYHFRTQVARIEACLTRGGFVRDRKGRAATPHQVILDTAATLDPAHDAAMHMRLALRAAQDGEDESAGKSLRAAMESAVLHLADLNTDALDLGEAVHFEFVPNAMHAVPSPTVAL